MLDTEGSYNGDNPNGWGWTADSFVYRKGGNIVATVVGTDGSFTGTFMGAYQVTSEHPTFVFEAIIRKLQEYDDY